MGSHKKGDAKEIPLGSFEPDSPPDKPGIVLDMQGGFPTMSGFQVLNGPLPHVYGALPEMPLGSTVGTYSAGTPQHWAGGKNHLYRMTGTMDDPSSAWQQADSLGPFTFNAVKWRFAQFNDDLIAVGGAGVAPQVATGASGVFAPLGGTPPVGATVVVAVNSQVMMFKGNTWYVSAIGGDNTWITTLSSTLNGTQIQAGFAPITDFPGDVVAAQPLFRSVIVFKQQGIWLGSYVGGDSIWSMQPISDVNGTWSQEATMVIPEGIAFLGLDDFYLCTGYTPQRIQNNLKEWFFDTADPALLFTVTSRYDVYHAIGTWHFVSKNPPFAGVPDRYVSYNFRAQRWATGYLNTPCVPIPNYHFGSPTDVNGFYFDTNNVLQTFRDAPGTMRLLTGYMGESGHKTQLLQVRPKYSYFPSHDSIQAFHVDSVGQEDVQGPVGMRSTGHWFKMRQTDRYHRLQLEITGTTAPVLADNLQVGAEISGLAFEFREAGTR